MKTVKIVLLIVLAAIVFGAVYFVFFYKNPAVKAAEAAINAIGTVSIDSEEAIAKAEEAYGALDEKERQRVGNKDTMTAARKEYNAIYDNAQAAEADRLIGEIGTVTKASEQQIRKAREFRDALTPAQKRLMTKLKELEAAEKEFRLLDVHACEDKIRAIEAAADDLDTGLPAAIKAARESYDALDYKEKLQVKNYGALQYAENAYNEYLEESGKAAIERERQARITKREYFIGTAKDITYAQLISNPDTYKNKEIALTVKVTYLQEAALLRSAVLLAMPSGGTIENVISLNDKRDVQEPAFAEGETYTVYGRFRGLKEEKTYEEGSGLFGSELFAKVKDVWQIPVIDVYYTKEDDLEALRNAPTVTETLNSIEEGLDLAGELAKELRKIEWQ